MAARQSTRSHDLHCETTCAVTASVHGCMATPCAAHHAGDLHHLMYEIMHAFCTFKITRIRHAIRTARPL